MRLLLVYSHPNPVSYGAALREAARSALIEAGHELREIDLYAEGFNPTLSPQELSSYMADTERNIEPLRAHVDALRWAEGWLVIYPTWTYGPPAMLKGWLDRVWLPGVSFGLGGSKYRPIRGRLGNIRWFCGITTSGSPWWWLRIVRDPGRSLFLRGLRPLYARRCKTQWLQLHSMNYTSAQDRANFLQRVQRTLRALPP